MTKVRGRYIGRIVIDFDTDTKAKELRNLGGIKNITCKNLDPIIENILRTNLMIGNVRVIQESAEVHKVVENKTKRRKLNAKNFV